MPELPDVEAFKRHLDTTALHQTVRDAAVLSSKPLKKISAAKFAEKVRGRELVDTRRHGKYLGIALDSGEWLVLHFGMTGALQWYGDGEAEPPRFTRIALDFKDGGHLAYLNQRQLGSVRVVPDFTKFIEEEALGADALDSELTLERFRALLDRRTALKSLLMNQNVLAGIGNVYADEILFQARLHPERRADQLDDSEIKELYRAMRHVLAEAIERKANTRALPKSWLLPRRSKEGACPRCDAALATKKVSGRTTCFCPECQR